MPKVRFNIEKKNSNKEAYIFLIFRYQLQGMQKIRIKYATGETINPQYWEKDRPVTKKGSPKERLLTIRLNHIENIVLSIYNENQFHSKESFVRQLDTAFEKQFGQIRHKNAVKEAEPEKLTLFKFIVQFIAERDKDPRFSPLTVKSYKNSFVHLQSFCTKKNREIDFDDVVPTFGTEYITYLFEDCNLQQSSVKKYIKCLKVMMNDANERELTNNLKHKTKAFSVSEKGTVQVYLNVDELERIDQHDFSDNLLLANARDWLIVACSTALRFGDFIQLTPDHIKERKVRNKDEHYKVIEFETDKTNVPVVIPINKILERCLERNGGKFPPLPPLKSANPLLNARIKEVGRLVGLDESVTITKTFGGTTTYLQKKKYELLKTHTGRRSGVSNLLLAGFDSLRVSKITGHRSINVFQMYDRVTKEENAEILSQDPFFKE